MKKSILALAVLGAITGAASAQTNVTIYGIVDAAVQYRNDGNPAGKTWTLESGQQSGSRLGFKGTEDLGGGLSAIFTLENGFNVDNGTLGQGGRLFGRQAWVGLNSTSIGAIKLGRQLTPLYTSLDQIDPFRINMAGNAQRIFGDGLYAADPLSRTDNTLTYTTPNFAGFTATAGWAFGEQAGAFSNNRSILLGANYLNGPVNVQFAFQKSNVLAGATGTGALLPAASPFNGAPALGITAAAPADLKTYFLGGTYDFGVAKAHLAYADTTADVGTASRKDRNWLVGASAPIGAAGTVLASWIRNDNRDIAAGKSNQYALGYTHALSKRTNLYTSLSYLKNDNGVALNAFAPGENTRIFNVGVRHQF
jgi:predicted porin